MATRICRNCGTALPDTAQFCVACGTPAPPPAKKPGTAGVVLAISLGVVVVAVAAIAVVVALHPGQNQGFATAPPLSTSAEQRVDDEAANLADTGQNAHSATPSVAATHEAAVTETAQATAAPPPPGGASGQGGGELGAMWSNQTLQAADMQWRDVAAKIPALPTPSQVTVHSEYDFDLTGAQAFTNALAQGDFDKIDRYCWTMSPSYRQRNYFDPVMRAAVLQALGTPVTGSEIGYHWEGAYVALFASDAEFGSAFMCPYVNVSGTQRDVLSDDVRWAVERYVRSFSDNPVSPKENQYDKTCANTSGMWDPLDTGHDEYFGVNTGSNPFGGLKPTGSPVTNLTLGERTSQRSGLVFIATGDIALTDGTSRTMTFLLSGLFGPTTPCIGDVVFGSPADLS